MSLLDRITQLKDDDRVELRYKTDHGWQVSSYPARELKVLLGERHQRLTGVPSMALPSTVTVKPLIPPIRTGLYYAPEPDANVPPDFNS